MFHEQTLKNAAASRADRARTAISVRFAAPRASSRLATFVQATRSTNATAPRSSNNGLPLSPTITD